MIYVYFFGLVNFQCKVYLLFKKEKKKLNLKTNVEIFFFLKICKFDKIISIMYVVYLHTMTHLIKRCRQYYSYYLILVPICSLYAWSI